MLTYTSGEGVTWITNFFLFTGFLLLKEGSAHIVDVWYASKGSKGKRVGV